MAFTALCSHCGKPMSSQGEPGAQVFRCDGCGFEIESTSRQVSPEEAERFIRLASRHTAAQTMLAHLPSAVIAAALVGILVWLLSRSVPLTLALSGAALFILLTLAVTSAVRSQRRMYEAMLKMHTTTRPKPPPDQAGP